MTSLSMLLASFNTTVDWLSKDREVVTPKSLNRWLQSHHGYDCVSGSRVNGLECFDLLSQSITNLTGRISYLGYTTRQKLPTLPDIKSDIESSKKSYVAHVKNGSHFVLVTGVDLRTSSIEVLDPYFAVNSYPYQNVSGANPDPDPESPDLNLPHLSVIPPLFTGALVYDVGRAQNVPLQYPTFKQCAAPWSSDLMVNTTICKVALTWTRCNPSPDSNPNPNPRWVV